MESRPPLPGTAEVLARIRSASVVPVLVVDDVQAAAPLAEVLAESRLLCAEVTLRTEAGLRVLRKLADHPELLAGAGTVLEPLQVDQAVQAGARFIVSPGLDPAVVERCLELGVPVLPGVATAGEVLRARRYGLPAAKFFPAEQSGGVPALRAFASAIPDIAFMPTGGIGQDNAPAYLDEPSVLGIGGSWMAPRDLLARHAWDRIRTLCAQAAQLAATTAERRSA
ncbi:bifunctional 4-hydroxy-2-oxoglutarate aldolase/2-dehydro-3-deoxy-phosphogluconate aldolase [Streptomyces sp. NBC_00433]